MEKNSVMVVCDSYYLSAKSGETSSRSSSPNRSLRGFNLFRVIGQKIGRGIRQSKMYKSPSSDEEENSNSWTSGGVGSGPKSDQWRKKESACKCDYLYEATEDESNNDPDKHYAGKERKSSREEGGCGGKKCLKFSVNSSGSDTCSSNDDSSESNETEGKGKRSHSSSNESSTSSSSSSSAVEFFKPANGSLCRGLKNLNLNSKALTCLSISQVKETGERRESISKEKKSKKSPRKILRQPATHTYVRGISGLPTVKVSIINNGVCYNNQYSRG